MKVLFINHFPLTGSGSGVYTLNLIKSLISLGHECAAIFPENRKDYEQYENISLYPVFFKGKEEIDNSLDFNFPCFSTHPRSSFNFLDMNDKEKVEYEQAFFNKIVDVVEEFNPDIIHAGHLWTLSGISSIIGKDLNIPLIVTSHGTDIIGINSEKKENISWGSKWADKAFDYADSIIAISKDNMKSLEELFPNSNKVKLIKNGFDSNIFYKDNSIKKEDVLDEFGNSNDFDNIISYVGKLTEIKGVDVLLEALKINSDKNLLTLIVGDGELREELENKVKELELENVFFLGNLPQEKLNKIYNIVDCSIVPSRFEAFGLVAAEAIACGTAVVASEIGGLQDIVSKDMGYLFEVDNSADLASKIEKVLTNKDKFNSRKIADKIKSKYSQDAIIKEVEDLYKKALTMKENVK